MNNTIQKPISPQMAWINDNFLINGQYLFKGKKISEIKQTEKFQDWVVNNKHEYINKYIHNYNLAFSNYIHRQQTESIFKDDPNYFLDSESGNYYNIIDYKKYLRKIVDTVIQRKLKDFKRQTLKN